LHTVIKLSTFSASLLKTGGLAIFMLNPVLDSFVVSFALVVVSLAIRA